MQALDFTQHLDLEIKINEKFDSIYSLSYALIDLQAVANSTSYITTHLEDRVEKLPSTLRTFGKKYKDELKLKRFSEGSFVAMVTAGVVTGLILKFLEKYFGSAHEIHNHTHIHVGASKPPIQVNFQDPKLEKESMKFLMKLKSSITILRKASRMQSMR
ncbi:hypothetical protein HORIV_35040 [Vreelandella olivaria]|uniref:Uncharacterized protein n=1 Tax=Vreelandella olivaria TaxID=390919 RepID=A0ABM7GKB1_9GAMM|nr:hypothetical protein HORIV_35040 [Halomonas olivaria]